MTSTPGILPFILFLSIFSQLCGQLTNADEITNGVSNPFIDPVLQHDWPVIDETSYKKYWAIRVTMPDLREEIPEASDFEAVYFIDPSAGQSGDGLSPESPLKSWSEVTFESGSAYLQKCGTTDVLSMRIFTQENVLMGAYGTGPRPVIVVTQSLGDDNAAIHAFSHVTVRDLNIRAPNLTSCIKMGTSRISSNITIYNNVLEDSLWGLRASGSNYRIQGNIIHNQVEDGMFLKSVEDLDIGWNYVFNVNGKWVSPHTPVHDAGGDGIQLESCADWIVHHNVLDRTSSGNRYAFFSNKGSGTGIFEYNYVTGPINTLEGGAGLFFSETEGEVVVRYNHIDRSLSGIFSHAALSFHGNIISNSESGIDCSTNSNSIHHNVLYNIEKFLIRNGGTVTNNILDNRKGRLNRVQNCSVLQNNLFMGSNPGDGTNFVADPLFVDPERDNFRLSPDSPAIDSGTTNTTRVDRDGFTIPQGATPDIGAYEFHGDSIIPWTVVYYSYPNEWKLTPHGYVYDGNFPWILRLPVVGDHKGTGQWFYILESSISDSGFMAYDHTLQSYILVQLQVSPWGYVYSSPAQWKIWD